SFAGAPHHANRPQRCSRGFQPEPAAAGRLSIHDIACGRSGAPSKSLAVVGAIALPLHSSHRPDHPQPGCGPARPHARSVAVSSMDRQRGSAWSLLTSGRVRSAFDIENEVPAVLDAYGRNLFGYSCLLARRLVEVGVSMVQVNLGRNETWDTHGNAFPHLKDNLLPPMDRCVSALLDDLDARGLLESTMIVMAGEFGRTPRISHLPQFYALAGRDHWGAVRSV